MHLFLLLFSRVQDKQFAKLGIWPEADALTNAKHERGITNNTGVEATGLGATIEQQIYLQASRPHNLSENPAIRLGYR